MKDPPRGFRQLPIATRWALWFTTLTMLGFSLLAILPYHLVRQRILSDARLVLDLQIDEIAESVRRHSGRDSELKALEAYIDQHIASAEQELHLGIRILDERGRVLIERGSAHSIPKSNLETLTALGRHEGLREATSTTGRPLMLRTARLPTGFAQVAVDRTRFESGVREVRNAFLLAAPVALLLSAALGWAFARRSLAPIDAITRTAQRISVGRMREHLPVSGNGDELDRLAETLNEMLERLDAGYSRARSFSRHAAHQLRGPLSRLHSRLEATLTDPRDPDRDRARLQEALADTDRLSDLVGGLLRLAETEAGIPEERRRKISLRRTADEVFQFFEPLAEDRGISLEIEATDPAMVTGDPVWLGELLSCLVDNAIRHTPRRGRVGLRIERKEDEVRVEVRDNGAGIPADELGLVFDQFFRGRHARGEQGSGLGLALAREIARIHWGSIQVESSGGHGAVFRVRLPAA